MSYDLDIDTLTEAAEQALTRPSSAHFWDDRLFTTHGATFHWAELGDDLVAESNYLTALDLIRGAAGDDADTHVIDGTSSHFACGSLRTIYVQVYEERYTASFDAQVWVNGEAVSVDPQGEVEWDVTGPVAAEWADYFDGLALGGDGWDAGVLDNDDVLIDDEGAPGWVTAWPGPFSITVHRERRFTPAFIEATKLALCLQDSAFLDESDHSERECERFAENLTEAVEHVQGDHYGDTEPEAEAILNLAREELGELLGHESDGAVSWTRVEEIYEGWRDAYFEERAEEIAAELSRLDLLIKDNRPQAGPGQLALLEVA